MRRMGALDCLHDVTIYALCFVFVEQSVCHEPISVLINIYAPGLVLVEHSVGSNINNA